MEWSGACDRRGRPHVTLLTLGACRPRASGSQDEGLYEKGAREALDGGAPRRDDCRAGGAPPHAHPRAPHQERT
eukprot:6854829-Prymnesium_polylepis.2